MPEYTVFDVETHLIAPELLAPPIICASWKVQGHHQAAFWANGDSELREAVEEMLVHPKMHIIGHNVAFDMACICTTWPEMTPLVFGAYEDQRVHDTVIREKLLMLGITGDVANILVDGEMVGKASFSLEALARKYLGIDLSEDKNDPNSWRANYWALDGWSAKDYPAEARSYAIGDVEHTEQLFLKQREMVEAAGQPLFASQAHQAYTDFCLKLMSAWGAAIDLEARELLAQQMEEALAPQKLQKLIGSGILQPGIGPMPYAKQTKKAEQILGKKISSLGLTEEEVERLTEAGVKIKAGVKEKKSMAPLRALVERVCEENSITLQKTATGATSTKADFLEELEHLDPILTEYVYRQKLQKVVTTELPRMNARVVHPNYDVIKETGRTSSYADKNYPSCNIQNVDPRARHCYVPRPGNVICSVDYSSIELVSLAQKQIDLFGKSTLGDLINDGVDPHAYLGAQLAYNLHQDFQALCQLDNVVSDRSRYELFLQFKTSPDDSDREFFAHWRKFAKPTGLGFPGGLGPATMVSYAKGTYGVIVTEQEAAELRAIWHSTFPEMQAYFDFISNDCKDDLNFDSYAYRSPSGLVRRGASFCAAANGVALQTPTADGAKRAIQLLVRACYDWVDDNELLFGHARPWGFIHDEILADIPEDELMHERAFEIAQLMVDGMKTVITDVEVKAEPALMRRWNREAEEVFDSEGLLQIWEPQE